MPATGPQQLRQLFSFGGTQRGIGVHAGHQVGRIVVVMGLLRCQFPDVDQNVAGKGQLPFPFYQNQLAGEVAALPLQDLKTQ